MKILENTNLFNISLEYERITFIYKKNGKAIVLSESESKDFLNDLENLREEFLSGDVTWDDFLADLFVDYLI